MNLVKALSMDEIKKFAAVSSTEFNDDLEDHDAKHYISYLTSFLNDIEIVEVNEDENKNFTGEHNFKKGNDNVHASIKKEDGKLALKLSVADEGTYYCNMKFKCNDYCMEVNITEGNDGINSSRKDVEFYFDESLEVSEVVKGEYEDRASEMTHYLVYSNSEKITTPERIKD